MCNVAQIKEGLATMIEVYFLREGRIYTGSIIEEDTGTFIVNCRELGYWIPLDKNDVFNTIDELLGSIKKEYLSRVGVI